MDEEKVVAKFKKKIKSFFGKTDKWQIQRSINPTTQYQYAYVLLDTDNADPNLTDESTFGWRFLNYVNLKTGNVCAVSTIRDLVAMRAYPMTMTLSGPSHDHIWMENYCFTILINEFQAQSYVGRDGAKYHFEFFPYIMNKELALGIAPVIPANPYFEFVTSGKGNGWYWFDKPITEFGTLSMTIRNPFDTVKISANTRTLLAMQFIYLRESDEHV